MPRIRSLMPDPPVNYSVNPTDTVAAAATLMGQHNIGIVMVLEGEQLVGVFSERDLICRVLTEGKSSDQVKVEEVMTKRVVIARDDDDPELCLKKMEQECCRHLPVFSGDKPIGMLSIRDLMRYILRQKEENLKMLEEYVSNP